MKKVISFSFSEELIELIKDKFPSKKRSRKIESILRKSLLNEEKKDSITTEQIKAVIEEVLNDGKEDYKTNKNEKALNAIDNIISIRD